MNGLDFGLSALSSDVFIRYRHETPGFQLVRARSTIAVIDRLLLHVDFPSAERDTSIGVLARGIGVLEYFPDRPPEIISRDITRAGMARNIGFVFDVSSPYPVHGRDGAEMLTGIGPHVVASGLIGAKTSFSAAYDHYKKHADYAGVPVFDTYGWHSHTEAGSVLHRPRLQLCGFARDLITPLTEAELDTANKLRAERMATHSLHRARLGVMSVSAPTAA